MLRTYAPFLLSLLVVLLLGVSAPPSHPPAQTDSRSIRLAEIRSDLRLFEDEPRYDYVAGDFKYSVIGNREFDEVFYQSALLAGRFYQIQEARSRYKKGQFDLETPEDADFLTLMSAEAVESLPTLVTEAQDLSAKIAALNPRSLKLLQIRRALRGVKTARKNVKMVLGSRDEVDSILDDYKALQADLETIEETDQEGTS